MTYIPNDLYEIFIYDHDANLVLAVEKWTRLEFSQRVNDPWNYSIDINLNRIDPAAEKLRNLKRDYFVDIYRTDPIFGTRTRVFEGFHHTVSETVTSTGDLYFGLYGGGYTKLLERRIVFPSPGAENNQKSGLAESLIKQYVSECMVIPDSYSGSIYEGGAVHTISIDGDDRIFPGMGIAGDLQRGVLTDYSARFTNLESVVKALIENGGLYYGIERGEELGTFVFDCRPIWGLDRRVDNTDGNTPAIFNVEFGNMVLPIFSSNHRYEKNVILVGGTGQGNERKIIAIADVESVEESPWGWSELFVDSRQLNTLVGLKTVGLAAIYERGSQQTLEFQVAQTQQSRWLRAWGLGDLVTAYYEGQRFDKVITEIRIDVSADNEPENIYVELKDIPSTSYLTLETVPEDI